MLTKAAGPPLEAGGAPTVVGAAAVVAVAELAEGERSASLHAASAAVASPPSTTVRRVGREVASTAATLPTACLPVTSPARTVRAMTRRARDVDPARSERREARRSELLDAAVEAIRRDGAAVSMELIAANAGVTKPIVYRHFGDRDGLAAAIADRYGALLVARLEAALDRALPPDQLLHSTIDTYLEFVEEEPELYRFLNQRLGTLSGVDDAAGLVAQVSRRVAIVLGEQLRALGRDSGAAEPWAFGIVGMVHMAGDWWLDRRTMTRARLAAYLTDLLWRGLEAAATVPDPAMPA